MPLSQVFRLGGPLVEGADEQHENEINQCAGESHSHIKALLRDLEGRVAALETTLSKAVSEISSIMKSIIAIKNHLNLPREVGAETTNEVDGVRIKEAVVAAVGPHFSGCIVRWTMSHMGLRHVTMLYCRRACLAEAKKTIRYTLELDLLTALRKECRQILAKDCSGYRSLETI